MIPQPRRPFQRPQAPDPQSRSASAKIDRWRRCLVDSSMAPLPPHPRIRVQRRRRTCSGHPCLQRQQLPQSSSIWHCHLRQLCHRFVKLSKTIVVSVNHRHGAEHWFPCAPPTGPDLQAGELSDRLECSSATIVDHMVNMTVQGTRKMDMNENINIHLIRNRNTSLSQY